MTARPKLNAFSKAIEGNLQYADRSGFYCPAVSDGRSNYVNQTHMRRHRLVLEPLTYQRALVTLFTRAVPHRRLRALAGRASCIGRRELRFGVGKLFTHVPELSSEIRFT
jgi:hypothetical protein